MAITIKSLVRKTPGTVSDTRGGVPGLRLEIGKRTRTFRISPRINGEQYNIKVATVTANEDDLEEAGRQLTKARAKARKILEDAANGTTPEKRAEIEAERRSAEERQSVRERTNTLEYVAKLYMEEEGHTKADAKERQRKLDKELLPELGSWPIRDITRAQVKALLLAKHNSGTPIEARRLRSLATRVFNYALEEGYVDVSVAAGIRLPGQETPRDRYLSKGEIASFWNGLPDAAVTPQAKLILKLALVTAQRRDEVVRMHHDELKREEGYWEIPAKRTKSGRATRVPLTSLAWSLIDAAGTTDGYVFSRADGEPPTSNSISQAMLHARPVLGLADNPATVHDLRRTAATQMGDLGIDRGIIRKLLNHKEEGITGQTYELSDRWSQKKLAMETWSNRLTEITTGVPMPDNVSKLERAG